MEEIRIKTNRKKAGYDIQERDKFLGGKRDNVYRQLCPYTCMLRNEGGA